MTMFFMWTHGEENPKYLNNFKSNLKFTFECNRNSINFLALSARLNNGELTRSVYVKPTDRHQHLHYRSSHLDHMKRLLVYC